MRSSAAIATFATTATLVILPACNADAAKLRQCRFLDAPMPSLVYAKGSLSCKTAVRIAKAGLSKIQYGKPTWSLRVSGQKWKCAVRTGTVVFECRRPGSRASLREA